MSNIEGSLRSLNRISFPYDLIIFISQFLYGFENYNLLYFTNHGEEFTRFLRHSSCQLLQRLDSAMSLLFIKRFHIDLENLLQKLDDICSVSVGSTYLLTGPVLLRVVEMATSVLGLEPIVDGIEAEELIYDSIATEEPFQTTLETEIIIAVSVCQFFHVKTQLEQYLMSNHFNETLGYSENDGGIVGMSQFRFTSLVVGERNTEVSFGTLHFFWPGTYRWHQVKFTFINSDLSTIYRYVERSSVFTLRQNSFSRSKFRFSSWQDVSANKFILTQPLL